MKNYLKVFLLTTASVFSAVTAFNLVIDPYRIYGLFDWPGVNRVKPYAYNEERLGKALMAQWAKPKALIVGNSRMEVGLDPEHPAWPAKPVLNLGVPNSTLAENRGLLQHAANAHKPDLVVFGVDFVDFLIAPGEERSSPKVQHDTTQAAEYPLSVYADGSANPDYQWAQWRAQLTKAISLDAFWHSVGTLYYQHSPYAKDLTVSGFNPMRDYLKIVADEGYGATFRQRDIEAAKIYRKKLKRIFQDGRRGSAVFDALQDVIRYCGERDIRLILVIYPYHAHLLETFAAAGVLPLFEEWKREVLAITREYPENEVVLWDFSGYNEFTTETVPSTGDRSKRVRWYWEAGHFKKELGDLMLARLFDHSPEDGRPLLQKFGVILTPENVEAQLAELKQQRQKYIVENSRDIASLEQFAGSH